MPPQQPTLTLEVQKGTAIKLPGAASTVFVAAPDIADVQVKSPTMIYVFAKKPGDTVLYAVDDQDRVLLNTIVSVTSPISRMKAQLDALHPGNGIQFDNQGEIDRAERRRALRRRSPRMRGGLRCSSPATPPR